MIGDSALFLRAKRALTEANARISTPLDPGLLLLNGHGEKNK
jgi:hypothetical protein